MYRLAHNLPNDLRLRILRNKEISEKPQNFTKLLPSSQTSSQNQNFVSVLSSEK